MFPYLDYALFFTTIKIERKGRSNFTRGTMSQKLWIEAILRARVAYFRQKVVRYCSTWVYLFPAGKPAPPNENLNSKARQAPFCWQTSFQPGATFLCFLSPPEYLCVLKILSNNCLLWHILDTEKKVGFQCFDNIETINKMILPELLNITRCFLFDKCYGGVIGAWFWLLGFRAPPETSKTKAEPI